VGKKYLLDSNVIIDYLNNKLPKSGMNFVSEIVDDGPYISVISKMEVLRFNMPDEIESVFTDFINYCDVISLDDSVVETTIEICKQSKVKLPDAIIAATCIDKKFILLTRNIKDFSQIENLVVINPHDL
jgi:predicted nucleic acid-binding protein